MLKIEITDVQTLDEKTLISLSKFLLNLAGHELSDKVPINVTVAAPPKVSECLLPIPPIDVVPPKMISQPLVNPASFPPTSLAPPPVANTVELDVDGLPWDNRIHARTKNKTVDGKWKPMRGVNPKLVDKVTQDLKQTMKVPNPFAKPKIANVIPPPPPPPVIVDENLSMPTVMEFPELMGKITAAITQNILTYNDIENVAKEIGLVQFRDLNVRPDLVPLVASKLNLLN